MVEEEVNTLPDQPCPMCGANTLTLMETEKEVPYFGNVYLFSMTCSNCKYHKADVECEKNEPSSYTIEIENEDDLKIRVVKSSDATVKIPRIITIEPGPAANGYVTNIEGILNRCVKAIESARDSEEDPQAKKKAKNLLKKLQKVLWGQEKLKIIIDDPSGNSAIISDKAVKNRIKNL